VEPTGDVGLTERVGEDWTPFVTRFSGNDALPGEPGAEDRPLSPVEVATRGIGLLADFLRAAPDPGRIYLSASPTPAPTASPAGFLLRGAGGTALAAVLEGAARLASGGRREFPLAEPMAAALRASRDGIRAGLAADPRGRRIWQLVDLVMSSLEGMAVDGLLSAGSYAAIDHLDFRDWLAKHGAAPDTLDSPIVRGMYDLTFAYEGGDRSRPRFAAGLGLQLAGRMLFDFKGSIFWRMQAGMGEVVFAPLYQALVRRGVEFRFFRRLDRLRLDEDRCVASVELTRQAEPAPGRIGYEPLVRVGGLPCWPDRPLAGQLAADPGDGLESHSGPSAETEILTAGADFDVAVLAVSVGMLPLVAADLIAAAPAWRRMVDRIATVATRSAQLWLDATAAELGWPGPPGVTLSGFGDTFDTWAEMSHLLARESWPFPGPRGLAYLCGAMPDADPAEADDLVRTTLRHFLDEEVGALWPRFRWESLRARYVRANLDPSDRYVQSLPGTGRYRLAPGRTGFANLAVAGDWTACGLDAGCIEAATRSGILAARAILSGAVRRPVPGRAA
jgi:hypothetical protein